MEEYKINGIPCTKEEYEEYQEKLFEERQDESISSVSLNGKYL